MKLSSNFIQPFPQPISRQTVATFNQYSPALFGENNNLIPKDKLAAIVAAVAKVVDLSKVKEITITRVPKKK